MCIALIAKLAATDHGCVIAFARLGAFLSHFASPLDQVHAVNPLGIDCMKDVAPKLAEMFAAVLFSATQAKTAFVENNADMSRPPAPVAGFAVPDPFQLPAPL